MKNVLKRVNEIACGNDGWMLGACKESTLPANNYTTCMLLSFVMQYIFPVVLAAVMLHVIYSGVIGFSVVNILCSISPFFVFLYLPIGAVDGWIVAFTIVAGLSLVIFYTTFYIKKFGIFSIIPFASWIAGLALWLVPGVGPILTAMVSVLPWTPAMVTVHWWAYND